MGISENGDLLSFVLPLGKLLFLRGCRSVRHLFTSDRAVEAAEVPVPDGDEDPALAAEVQVPDGDEDPDLAAEVPVPDGDGGCGAAGVESDGRGVPTDHLVVRLSV